MGNLIAKIADIFSDFGGGSEYRILLLGLDAAGKTTLLYKTKIGELVHTVPTIGFNVEEVKVKNLSMTVWDVGGQHTIRALWRYYYQGSHAIIWVLDSADAERMDEARDTLQELLAEDSLTGIPLIVFANKQDMPKAMPVAEVAEALNISSVYNRPWHIQACCAASGDGIYEGFDWLSETLRKAPKNRR